MCVFFSLPNCTATVSSVQVRGGISCWWRRLTPQPSWELSHIPRPSKGTFESMIFPCFFRRLAGYVFLVSCRVVLWTWIKRNKIFRSITIDCTWWPWISGLERKPSPDVKGSYIIGWTTNLYDTLYFTIWNVVSQGMLAKSWTQNSWSSLESFFETHPPNFIPLSKKRKKTRISKKRQVYTTTSFPSSRPHLTFSKKRTTWHFFFRSKFSPPTGLFFFRLSLVVGLLQEQVAPRGRFPSTTDDKQESLQKTGANLGGWSKKPTDFQCFLPVKSWLVILGILLLAYERTPLYNWVVFHPGLGWEHTQHLLCHWKFHQCWP